MSERMDGSEIEANQSKELDQEKAEELYPDIFIDFDQITAVSQDDIEFERQKDPTDTITIYHGAAKTADTTNGTKRLLDIASSIETGVRSNSPTFCIKPVGTYWQRGGIIIEIPRNLVAFLADSKQEQAKKTIAVQNDGVIEMISKNYLSMLDFEGKLAWPKHFGQPLSVEDAQKIENANIWLAQSREKLSTPKNKIQTAINNLISFFNSSEEDRITLLDTHLGLSVNNLESVLKQSNFHEEILSGDIENGIGKVLNSAIEKLDRDIDAGYMVLFNLPEDGQLSGKWIKEQMLDENEFCYKKELSSDEINKLRKTKIFFDNSLQEIVSGVDLFRQKYKEIYS